MFCHGALELYNGTKTYCMPGLKKKVNFKLSRCASSRHVNEWIYSSIHFCSWLQVGVHGHVGAPANLPPRKESLYPLSGRLDGPQKGSDDLVEKCFRFSQESNHGSSIIQPPSRLRLFIMQRHGINQRCFKERH